MDSVAKRIAVEAVSEYFNSDRKLADIIEMKCSKLSVPTRERVMLLCESMIPTMISIEVLNGRIEY